jgi:hypothetical protein
MVTATYPVAPEIEPLKGTLLDAANVKDGIAWLDGDDLWASPAGMTFGSAPVFCGVNAKDLDDNEVDWVSGIQFGAYGGYTCRLVGTDMDEMESLVRQGFANGESVAVERALMEQRFITDPETPDRWVAPVDITPAGGAVKPGVGVALLEGYYASVYQGAPTLHLARVIASLLLGVDGVSMDGDTIRTKLGSKIAAGGGYDYPNTGPAGTEPAAGEKWIYATGGVYVGRGEMQVIPGFDQSNNDATILAERPYIVAVDGPVVAVRVKVEQ